MGYPQSLTDPSYHRQILILTYPLIGNYGIPDVTKRDENNLLSWVESEKVWVSGLVVSEYSEHHSHWSATKSLSDWLSQHNVPGIEGVDTRLLTQKVREKGTLLGLIRDHPKGTDEEITFSNPNKFNLVEEVSTNKIIEYGPRSGYLTSVLGSSDPKVAVIDVGVKTNQIRCLVENGLAVDVLPWNAPFAELAEKYDGIFISNGPGDPAMCTPVIQNLKSLIESDKDLPIFGICLGHQLLARAAGFSTVKMKYGNRGHNLPCRFMKTERCFVTSQNHGFAVCNEDIKDPWVSLFENQNDGSNEGLSHLEKAIFSVQFHPEHRAGPEDMKFLFDIFAKKVIAYKKRDREVLAKSIPDEIADHLNTKTDVQKHDLPKKVLILGSGGLSIGQAGEFDYSGSQAIKALKEEKIQTILINPNIATVQTNPILADKIYFLPITYEYVVEVIKWERPDGIFLMFGGQTALNCGIKLESKGIFKDFNIRVLGTPIKSIKNSEDREKFAQVVKNVGAETVESQAVKSWSEAKAFADKVKYPVLVRAAYALGGLGSGFATNERELKTLVDQCFVHSKQVFLDKSLKGWKEVEYEVVRDIYDNCVTVCNMEVGLLANVAIYD